MKKLMKQIKFMRFGGLSAVKQKGYGKDTFHAPPAKHGIYCFPESGVERFLLGKDVFDNRRMIPLKLEEVKKDKDGYPQCMQVWKDEKTRKAFDELFEKEWKNGDQNKIEEFRKSGQIYAKHADPRKFSYTGELWHHLEYHVKVKDVLKRHGSWILTTYKTWLKAYQKDYAAIHPNNTGCNFSKDHLEVFIEKVN